MKFWKWLVTVFVVGVGVADAAEAKFPGLRRLMDTPLRDTSICQGPDGTWYLTGTREPFWKYNEGIQVWKSPDLVHWESLGLVWKYGDSPWHRPYLEKRKPLWAPEIHYLKGTFWLTYSLPGWDGTAKTSGCGLLKSTTGKAEGPYEDVQPNERLGDEIDASLFQDDDGSVYFLWHSGKIAKMKPDMSGLAEPYRWLKTTVSDPNPKHHSGLCAGIFGKDSFDHVGFEGMFLFKSNGRYYLSCAEVFEGRYSCMVATSTNLFGPYSARYEAIPHGGHNMFFKDDRGQWWSSYFGSDGTAPWRERPGILPIQFSDDGRVQPDSAPKVPVTAQVNQPGKKINPTPVSVSFDEVTPAKEGGFLFVTFKGESSPMTEQIYFCLSRDGRRWEALNGGKPILISRLGEKGVRDPYLLRSGDGRKFFLIATDLSIYFNRDWKRAVRAGSKSIVVWESADLVNWSEPRLAQVAPDNAGCAWAPEAVYDDETQDYLVFWASTTAQDQFAKHRIWACRTRDFKTFGKPFVYIERPNHIIDTTIIRDGGRYYRFSKDDKFKTISMETAEKLMGSWQEVPGFSLTRLTGYEGPTSFLLEPGKWCLLLDYYSKGAGYQPFMSQDLAGGQFTAINDFQFPYRLRHGSVLRLTNDEYERVRQAFASGRAVIRVGSEGKAISPDLFGVFFEDINYAADGGLYAELIQNRSFEYSSADRPKWNALTAWERVDGTAAVESANPIHPNNPHYVVLNGALRNTGFDGLPLRAGEKYEVSFFARGAGGSVTVRLGGREVAFQKLTDRWAKYSATIEAGQEQDFVIRTTAPICLDVISVFPQKTFRNRPNGLRADLAQAIADLKPKFMRFPGGCLVHGDGLGNMYRWKDTIGPVEQRREQRNIWGYHQTVGLGYFEYFQFCEDIGAKPLPVVPAGVCCQNSGRTRGTGQKGLPMEEMPSYVQEVLDLIEWANGPSTSTWGAKRAAAGHPEPFGLKYLGVGNEEHITPVFKERFKMIYDAVKAKHPGIIVVGTVGPFHSGTDFVEGWKFADELRVPIVDEHYYVRPDWFLNNLTRYDTYDRSKSKVYLGEYAAHDVNRANTLRSALAEAAYMTSLERNGDVVWMASYAPLLAKRGRTQWRPDLIYFTNTNILLTANYYVQQLFSQNQGDTVLSVTVDLAGTTDTTVRGMVGVGSWETQAEFKDMKVTKDGKTVWAFDGTMNGWKTSRGNWEVEGDMLRQSSGETDVRAVIGDPSWSDYTFTLKARKLSGREGFLIIVGQQDGGKSWWNIGGWGNTRHALEMGGIESQTVEGHIETGRWYDIRVELKGSSIKCYLDGKLIHDAKTPGIKSLYASASRDDKTGEIILKVVNAAPEAQAVEFNLAGLNKVSGPAKVVVLTSEKATDENTLEEPTKVVPKTQTLNVNSPSFTHTLPGNSLTVLRLK